MEIREREGEKGAAKGGKWELKGGRVNLPIRMPASFKLNEDSIVVE